MIILWTLEASQGVEVAENSVGWMGRKSGDSPLRPRGDEEDRIFRED
jgi:hypothetical protein